jgi:probable HAF family extracellular repeat protein
MRQQMNRSFLLSIVAVAAAFTAPIAQAALPRYKLTLLPGEFTVALALNNKGEVTGSSAAADSSGRAFLYSHGKLEFLQSLPASTRSEGRAINDRGEIAGQIFDPKTGVISAFLHSSGTFKLLDAGPYWSHANGINNAGQVVGQAVDMSASFPSATAFLYSDGTMTFPGSLLCCSSEATSINDKGQIAGFSEGPGSTNTAFRYSDQMMTDLGALGGGYGSRANAINDKGQVTGWASVEGGAGFDAHAFIYSRGVMKNLGALPKSRLSEGRGINDAGQVVGISWLSQERPRAFIYTGGKMYDLNKLTGRRHGFELRGAAAINDAGQIVGNGHFWGSQAPSAYRAFLLTPTGMANTGD